MSTSRLAYLFKAYVDKTATAAERHELMDLLAQTENNEQIRNLLTSTWQQHTSTHQPFSDAEGEQMLASILEQGRSHKPVPVLKPGPAHRWRRVLAVAAVLMVLCAGGYLWFASQTPAPLSGTRPPVRDSIVPGTDKAVLTLANGTRILLDSTQKGTLASQGHVQVMNTQNAELAYNAGHANIETTMFNTLSTPRGGQYKLQLADGTKVWLNASSSITFPVAFTGNERRVSVTGEAYFEVSSLPLPADREGMKSGSPASQGKMPFIVDVNGKQTVEVLGTHFNINAYIEEESIRTTLLEGKVKVVNRETETGKKGSVLLKPGEQAIATLHSPLTIDHSPDVEEVMAWKNGWFLFNSSDLATIMRQVSRWYDVDIVYEGKIPAGHYSGAVSRSNNIDQVLKIMQGGDVGFRIEGKKVTVFEDHHQP